jgi:hypothetical protein
MLFARHVNVALCRQPTRDTATAELIPTSAVTTGDGRDRARRTAQPAKTTLFARGA